MLERGGGGKIINVASLLSFQGGITVPGYAAAKGGVVQLTKALANEWAPHGINVNAIAPGYMETDNTDGAPRRRRPDIGRSPNAFPPGGGARPQDLAGAACFSPRARRTTCTVTCSSSTAAGWAAEEVEECQPPLNDRAIAASVAAGRLPFVGVFAQLVGPAALTAAGMIGAGAVATRLLAGAWFGFDLLWVALYVVPMVVFTLDSASRVGVLSGGRGMFEMIRTDIGAWLAWGIFVPTVLVNVVVNMSQMSAMVEGVYGALGMLPPARLGYRLVARGGDGRAHGRRRSASAVFGGYKRVEKIMTALLHGHPRLLHRRGDQGAARLADVARARRRSRAADSARRAVAVDTGRVRSGFTQIMAIAGQALPPAVFLSYGYLAANAGYTDGATFAAAFWKTVQNLGVIWGLFSVVVIVAGATALHAVYTGSGPTYLGVSHYSQIESIPVAGQVLGPAFPGALGLLAPRFFSLGLIAAAFTTLISVSLTMTYFCLDMVRQGLALHESRTAVQGRVRVFGSRSPHWSRRSGSCRRCSRRSSRWSGTWRWRRSRCSSSSTSSTGRTWASTAPALAATQSSSSRPSSRWRSSSTACVGMLR